MCGSFLHSDARSPVPGMSIGSPRACLANVPATDSLVIAVYCGILNCQLIIQVDDSKDTDTERGLVGAICLSIKEQGRQEREQEQGLGKVWLYCRLGFCYETRVVFMGYGFKVRGRLVVVEMRLALLDRIDRLQCCGV
jgi:hypothetical protein